MSSANNAAEPHSTSSVTASEQRLCGDTIVCFRTILHKCQEQLSQTHALLMELRATKRYPYTSFYHEAWGEPGVMTHRTIDTLRSVSNMNAPMWPELAAEIYRANARFQTAIKNLVLTRSLISLALDEFVELIGSLDMGSAEDEESVSSSTLTVPSHDRCLAEIRQKTRMVQQFLNQLPLAVSPVEVELRAQHIYDRLDDSAMLHRLLSDPAMIANVRPLCTNFRLLLDNWDALLSEEPGYERINRMREHRMADAAARMLPPVLPPRAPSARGDGFSMMPLRSRS